MSSTRLLFATATILSTLALRTDAQQPAATKAPPQTTIQNMNIAIGPNGITITSAVDDDVRLCVAPRPNTPGETHCFTVGQIRRGELVVRKKR